MHNVIFHIGLHKTATTTLQKQVFSRWPGIVYVSKNPEVSGLIRAVTTTDPIYFEGDYWRDVLASNFPSDKPIIISKESLSGALFAGIGKRGVDHRSSILDNLASVVPESRIIIVLRRQDGLARSLYRQYLNAGGTESINAFYGIDRSHSPILSLDRFRFLPYLNQITSLFSSGVLILTFEELVTHPREFLRKLSAFINLELPDLELNRSNETRLGSLGMGVTRYLNRIFRSQLNPGGLLPLIPVYRHRRIELRSLASLIHHDWPIRGSVSKSSRIHSVSEKILATVRDDNRILDQQFKLGLSEYDYY